MLAREARKARRASVADSAGMAVPSAALAAVQAMMRFCAGQMMPQTLSSMMTPMPPPIAMDKGLRFAIREGGRTVGAGTVTEVLE